MYERVFKALPIEASPQNDGLEPHISRLADTEIDILVEDTEYFVFIEAKEVRGQSKAKFEPGEVHQLVRQYVQGKVLEKTVAKTFALATIGANNAQ